MVGATLSLSCACRSNSPWESPTLCLQRLPFVESMELILSLAHFGRTRLEMLNLSQNRIVSALGLASLPTLIVLNLGEYIRHLSRV